MARLKGRRWLFVAVEFVAVILGYGIKKAAAEPVYFTSGSSVKTYDSVAGTISLVATYTDSLRDLTFDLSGNIYAVTNGSDIVRLTPQGTWSVIASGLYSPGSIVSYQQNLFVVNQNTPVITKIGPNSEVTDFVTLPQPASSLAADVFGNLYAAGGKKIYKITPNGSVTQAADFTQVFNQFNNEYTYVGGVAVGGDGLLYAVRNASGGAVYSVNSQGIISLVGTHPLGLIYARQIAVNANRLLVLHTWSPYAGYSQISDVIGGQWIGYSGFQANGIAFASAAVPEPTAATLLATGLLACAIGGHCVGRRGVQTQTRCKASSGA